MKDLSQGFTHKKVDPFLPYQINLVAPLVT